MKLFDKKKFTRGFLLIVAGYLLVVLMLMLTGCNQQVIDLNYKFDYAWISLPNGECVEGKVQSWTDYEDGDQIQVKIDGITYLTDTTRCVMAAGKK